MLLETLGAGIEKDGEVYLHIEKRPKKQRRAVCGSADVIRKGQAIGEIRSAPIGEKPAFLVL